MRRRRVTEEELIQAERSMAMSPSLPKDVVQEFVEEIRSLRADREATVEELERLLERLRGHRS